MKKSKSFFDMVSANNKVKKRSTNKKPKRTTTKRVTTTKTTKKPNNRSIFSLAVPNRKKQAERRKILIGKSRDIDKDGVPNWRDCRPHDPHRQDNGIPITDSEGILHALLKGKKAHELSFSEYSGMLKDALKRTRIIKTINGYGIFANKWKGEIIYGAVDMKSGLNLLYGRKSLEQIVDDIKRGDIEELRKDDPIGRTVKGSYGYILRSGKEEDKYGGRALRFKGRSGDKVLDIGAGSHPDFRATHAIDQVLPDEKFKNLKYKHGYDFSKEGTILPYRDNSFDTVVSYGALGRNFETQTIYDEIYRVLKPGGRLEFNADSSNTEMFLKEARFPNPHMEYYFDKSLNKKIGVFVTKKP